MTLSTKIATTIEAAMESIATTRYEEYLETQYTNPSTEYTDALASALALSAQGWTDNGTVLASLSTILGAPELVFNAVSGTPTVTVDQNILEVNTSGGASIINLPDSAIVGKTYTVIKETADANTVTISATATIEGGSIVLTTQYDKAQVIRGTNVWLRLL